VDNPNSLHRARAVSLLETTIAVGILGVGLIMVAAVFPVALSQHRDSTYLARANELLSKADAMLRSRFSANELWTPTGLSSGEDSPWYLMPSTNLYYGAEYWDDMRLVPSPAWPATYANVMNGATSTDYPAYPTWALLYGLDTLSDTRAPYTNADIYSPFTDDEFTLTPNRLVWYGFYRRLADGTFNYAAAVCRQQREHLFVQQDLSENTDPSLAPEAKNPYSTPIAVFTNGLADARRLPVPWRVSVRYDGVRNLIGNPTTVPMLGSGLPLGVLAPPGSKIMIHGAVHVNELVPSGLATEVKVPAGRVLTVSDVIAGYPAYVEVLGEVDDLPLFDPFGDTSRLVTFDVWVFPPPIRGSEFTNSPPVIAWKLLL
jgi:hypothetical protein